MIGWALFFFLAGMVLILAEFVLPGGVCGGVGVVMLIAAGFVGIHEFPEHAFFIILTEVVAAGLCIIVGFYVIARTGVARALKLQLSQRKEDGYVNMESDTSLLGAEGVVKTALRPSGTILVGDRRLDAVSNSTFIEKGLKVRVVEVNGNRIVVEEAEPG